MKIKSLSVAISVALTSFSAISAQEKTQDTLVVTGSALDQLVQTQINSESLEQKQASDMKDVLNTIPSVTVDGNARYSRKVFVRGLEDKFSVVTIDGSRQRRPAFPSRW